MTTYFAGTELDAFVVTGAASEVTSQAVGGFTRGGVQLQNGQGQVTAYCVDPADGTRKGFIDIWSHFVRYAGNNNVNGRYHTWYNSSGVPVVRISSPSNFVLQVERWTGSAWVSVGGTFSCQYLTSETFDMYIKVAVAGRIEIFKGGVTQASYAGDTSALSNIAYLVLSPEYDTLISQQIIMATYNTIGHTIRVRTPSGVSAVNAAWTGAYTDVNDFPNNDATFILSGTAAQKETFTGAALGATPSNQAIKAVVVNFRIRRDTTGPQNVSALLRSGSTDYPAPFACVQPGLGYEGRGWIYDNNPATAAPWASIAAVNGTEFGLVSAT